MQAIVAFGPPFRLTLVAWVLFELSLVVRERRRGKGGRARDRGTRIMISLAIDAAVALSFLSFSVVPSLRFHGPYPAVGLAVLWLGLAIRAWAVATLGGAFRTTVEVDPNQAVAANGPYRWVRHPSYTGLLLILIGFGLAIGDWLAPVVCLVLPLSAVLRRIRVEEAELIRVLGDPYRAYQQRTKRLVPAVW